MILAHSLFWFQWLIRVWCAEVSSSWSFPHQLSSVFSAPENPEHWASPLNSLILFSAQSEMAPWSMCHVLPGSACCPACAWAFISYPLVRRRSPRPSLVNSQPAWPVLWERSRAGTLCLLQSPSTCAPLLGRSKLINST